MDTILYFRLTPKISIQTQVSSRPCGPSLSPQQLQLMLYLLSTDFGPGPFMDADEQYGHSTSHDPTALGVH